MNITNNYHKLEVFDKAYKLALAIHKLSRQFPKEELFSLTSQIRRSSKSVALNIAEGATRRESKKTFAQFLYIAMGSCEETIVLLSFASDLNYISDQNLQNLQGLEKEYQILAKQIFTLIKKT